MKGERRSLMGREREREKWEMNEQKKRKKKECREKKKKEKKKWEMKNWGKVCVGRLKNMGGTYVAI